MLTRKPRKGDTEWNEWNGKGTPPSCPIVIRLRDGTEWAPSAKERKGLDWRHGRLSSGDDIVAYRSID